MTRVEFRTWCSDRNLDFATEFYNAIRTFPAETAEDGPGGLSRYARIRAARAVGNTKAARRLEENRAMLRDPKGRIMSLDAPKPNVAAAKNLYEHIARIAVAEGPPFSTSRRELRRAMVLTALAREENPREWDTMIEGRAATSDIRFAIYDSKGREIELTALEVPPVPPPKEAESFRANGKNFR